MGTAVDFKFVMVELPEEDAYCIKVAKNRALPTKQECFSFLENALVRSGYTVNDIDHIIELTDAQADEYFELDGHEKWPVLM